VYDARGRFTAVPAPTKDELHALTARIAARITRLCERRALDPDLRPTTPCVSRRAQDECIRPGCV
jgi:hypothetical protein